LKFLSRAELYAGKVDLLFEISKSVRFWPSLAVHSLAANAPIGIILGNAIEGAGLYKAAKLQVYRLKIHAASNGLTFEKFQNRTNSTLGHVWLAISRPSIQIFQLFFGNP